MIGTIRGTLNSLDGNIARVQLGPIGLDVALPAYLAEPLAERVGSDIELWTTFQLDATTQSSFTPRLLGFGSASERRFFEVFTTVKGLGSKRAMRALTHPPGTVSAWIAAGDAKRLIGMPEIGKRLADTIIAELSGKIDTFIDPGVTDPDLPARAEPKAPDRSASELDAIAALIALGQSPSEAEAMLDRVLAGSNANSLTTDQLVAAAFGA